MIEDSDDKYIENSHDVEESGGQAENSGDGKEFDSNVENSSDGKEYGSRAENKVQSDYFIKNAVLGDYEITINSINLKSPAEILEKLFPLKDDETLTNEEKSQQVMNIILEYME